MKHNSEQAPQPTEGANLKAEKKAQKRQRKTERATKRADFVRKHRVLFLIWRLALFIAVIAALTLIGMKGYELYQQYTGTLKWEQADTTPIADIDPAVLYASEKERKARIKYDQTQDLIWDESTKAFKDEVNDEAIKTLTTSYENMTEEARSQVSDYTEIVTLWNVRKNIDSLFTDSKHTAFVSDISLTNLATVVNDSFNTVVNYLQGATVKHDAAQAILNELYTISDTAISMAEIITITNESYTLSASNNKVSLTTSMENEAYESLKTRVSSLPYSWDFVTKILQPLIDKSATTVAANQKLADEYAAYQADQAKKSDFEAYVTNYNATMHRLQNSIVTYQNFVGQSLSSLQSWAAANGIKVSVSYTTHSTMVGLVITQTPSTSAYNKIVSGSTISVVVGRAPAVSSSSSSTSSSSTSSSSTQEVDTSSTSSTETSSTSMSSSPSVQP